MYISISYGVVWHGEHVSDIVVPVHYLAIF